MDSRTQSEERVAHVASPRRVRELLAELEISPRKHMGQNFLVDGNIRDLTLGAAELTRGDVVLEIGPGLGVLTERMAPHVGRLVAVEKDDVLAGYLTSALAVYPSVRIVRADALDLDLVMESAPTADGRWVVVSNLPYAAGTRILVNLLVGSTLPDTMVLMLQRETAQRIEAAPGNGQYGPVAILATLCYDVEQVKDVGPNCFWPRPDVYSRVIRLQQRDGAIPDLEARADVLALAKRAFMARRKKVGTWLRSAAVDDAALGALHDLCSTVGIDLDLRPENIAPARWLALSNLLRQAPAPLLD